MQLVSLLVVVGTVFSVSQAYKDLGNGAVESKQVNPGPKPKIDPLESLGEGDELTSSQNDRNAVGKERRWVNGTVPFVYDASLTAAMKAPIQQAFDDYHKYTCMKFRPKSASDLDWIVFKDGAGCSSFVGRLGQGAQAVTLGTGCGYKGTVIHELMHAIGFGHEQCRPDRDQFITVDLNQVPKDKQNNFKKYDGTLGTVVGNTFGFKYDFGSIMHYSETAFSSTGKPSMKRKDGQPLKVQHEGFGDYDIKKINIYYGCDGGKAPAPQNEFTTTVEPPPAEWGCKSVVVDPSCDNVERRCSGAYSIGWSSKGTACTRKCQC